MNNPEKRPPDVRYVARNTERNEPCKCGAKRINKANKEVAVKAKNCCLPKAIDSYFGRFAKITKNEGKRNYLCK